MKLSDTQLIILSSASRRTDHAVALPATLKGNAAKKVVSKLLTEKLLQELRAKEDMPVWRRGDHNRLYSLRITRAGLRVIGVEDAAETLDKTPADGLTEIATIDASPKAKSGEVPGRPKPSSAEKASGSSAWTPKATRDGAKPESKQDKILALLQRPKGATLDDLVKETQWQKHSVRGFLAGTVRKKLNLPLRSEKIDSVRTYRIGTANAAKSKKTAAARKA